VDLRLGELMTHDPLTVPPGTPLSEAAAAMRERGVGSVIVADDTEVVGIVTERDLVKAAADGAHPTDATVDRWMTADPVTFAPDGDVTHALDQMMERHFRHIPIVDGDKLVGIVSFRQLVEAAKIRKVDPWAPGTGKGLENITVAESEVSYIDGQRGRLIYRGYNAPDLAAKKSFIDVWHLLHYGDFPSDDSFEKKIKSMRASPVDVDTLRVLAEGHGTFMSTLQAAIAAAGAALGLQSWLERDPVEVHEEALRLGAVMPTLVTSLYRLSQGKEPIEPDPSLDEPSNYLWMMHGTKPSDDQILAANQYLILLAEHGMNASTFTGRVIASTGADVGSAVAGASGALSGPLHGGAPSLVLDMLDEIGSVDNAETWVKDAVENGKRIMGFGHRVYKAEDPRAARFRDTSKQLGAERVSLAQVVEAVVLEELRASKPGRALYTNVEFWSAVILEHAGVPRDLITPTFAVSRTIGWTAHILEQVRDNRLIRPTAEYTGPMDLKL
jgi:citrate synthase